MEIEISVISFDPVRFNCLWLARDQEIPGMSQHVIVTLHGNYIVSMIRQLDKYQTPMISPYHINSMIFASALRQAHKISQHLGIIRRSKARDRIPSACSAEARSPTSRLWCSRSRVTDTDGNIMQHCRISI